MRSGKEPGIVGRDVPLNTDLDPLSPQPAPVDPYPVHDGITVSVPIRCLSSSYSNQTLVSGQSGHVPSIGPQMLHHIRLFGRVRFPRRLFFDVGVLRTFL